MTTFTPLTRAQMATMSPESQALRTRNWRHIITQLGAEHSARYHSQADALAAAVLCTRQHCQGFALSATGLCAQHLHQARKGAVA